MATVELKVPMQLGGLTFEAGLHQDIEIVRNWFVDEMEKVGLFIIHEGEVLYPSAPETVAELSARDALKKEADELGIQYPANIKGDKLTQLIADKKAFDKDLADASVESAPVVVPEAAPETVAVPNPADVAV